MTWCSCWLVLAGPALSAPQIGKWPAEPEQSAANLSGLKKGLRKDLSGAVWNPVTRTLWVCRDGPRMDSRLWVFEEDGAGDLQLASDGELKGEWSQLGDCEGVAFADFEEKVVYLIVEGEEKIYELDVSQFGNVVVNRVYDTSPFLPLDGSAGAEGITFVPDEHLARSGFVDGDGLPRTSRRGMGGLMLVGHQNGGGIYAFDLDRSTGDVDYVGEYRVLAPHRPDTSTLSRVVGLEFDRSSGRLFAWHGLRNANLLSVIELGSNAVDGEVFRAFESVRVYAGPGDRRFEGLALVPDMDCGALGRALFLTVDDGKDHSLFRYDHFAIGCVEAESQWKAAPVPSTEGQQVGEEKAGSPPSVPGPGK